MKQISISETNINEAMAHIDLLDGLSPKNKGCLRLLTEEMFSMVKELLKTDTLDFEVKRDGMQYSLGVATKTRVDENARQEFLSMSSSGENTASRGVKGLIGSVLEALSYESTPGFYGAPSMYGMCTMGAEYACMWSLSAYLEKAPKEKVSAEWDGMEKSIIANFADDVAIGVRSGKLEMTVTKAF